MASRSVAGGCLAALALTLGSPALAEADPKSQAAVETLTALYEQARYLPRDAALTPEQLAEASQAVQRIRRS